MLDQPAFQFDEAAIDSGDPRQHKRAVKAAKQLDVRKREALKSIMQTAEGRMWMHSLLERCAPGRTPFSRDPIQMAFNCGSGDIGLWLMAELHAVSTDLYLIMMQENTPQ